MFFLIFEAIILHDFHRLDSNILLSCIPVTYYLFISVIYITNHINLKIKWSQYSKYYYLLHPMMIFIVSFIFKGNWSISFIKYCCCINADTYFIICDDKKDIKHS